ncbi:LysR family transcriptional regulator [Beijerinckia sp. L45]|uniref:LysR family transcriptional regulator n=1 Tax=Beijerinckia sp. L45 TaxID=1641855 RepID=UPI001FEFA645|nr:LysR family transcriptional regulator [Beijerinckia sp. L45]
MAVFVKAADLGSFTAAAAALDLSPQMVGRHVGFLEERLGVELIRRTTRRQSLTSIGQAFYERCRTILAETDAAESLAQDLGTTHRRHLRVGAPVSFGACCLAPIVSSYLEAQPAVSIDLVLSDRFVDIVDEGYDVVVRLGDLEDSSFLSRTLAPHRLVACASPGYLAKRGAPATPHDLADHDCLGFIYSTGLPFADWIFTRDDETQTVRVRSRFQSNDSRVLRTAALAGGGIFLQAESVLRDDLASGALVPVLEDFDAPVRAMHLLFSANRRQTPTLRSFVDLVVEVFG